MRTNVIDLNDARPQGHYSARQLADPHYIGDLKGRMAGSAESIVRHLWPAGRLVGDEFEVGDVNGSAGKSLKISLRRSKLGVGRDFAGNEAFGDLIDAWAYATRGGPARGRAFAEVCEEIEGFLGSPYKPVGRMAERPQARDWGPPTATYTYTDDAGAPLVVIYRHELPELDKRGKPKKEFRPWDVAERVYRSPKADRPLYNLPGIKSEPWVVVVEGEGKADALNREGIVATCAMGGSKAPIDKTNWSPLAGKHVVIWPDADEEGLEFAAKVQEHLTGIAASARQVAVPANKPKGWDAADALAESMDVRSLLLVASVQKPAGRQLDLADWAAASFTGDPKPIQWCVESIMPLGKAGLLVAMGDAGKGILTLDLALKIASDKPAPGVLGEALEAFGNLVATTGSVVILAAEDDRDTIHRRLHSLDPDGARRKAGRLFVVPLPNAGGPLPIVKTSSTEGPYVTPEWGMLRRQLENLPDLRLIVLDPLASFVHADVNADPAAGAFVTGLLASLATETGASVLLPHHMAKRDKPINSPEEARAAIRGSTAIVDGVRFAYALWAADEMEGKRICVALGETWERNRVFKGAIVKSNDPADRTVRLYIRDMRSGLLVDRTGLVKGNDRFRHELELDELALAIVSAAGNGYPYTHTGSAGVFERRGELPSSVRDYGRNQLREMVDELLSARRITKVRYKGQASPWLDAIDGDFAQGIVELKVGAYRP